MGKKGGYLDGLWDAVSELTGVRTSSPHDMRPIYREAVQAGVLEPGKTGSFALHPSRSAGEMLSRNLSGPQTIEASIRRHYKGDPSGLGSLVQARLPEGASEEQAVAEALRMHGEAMQDPRTYVHQTTPRQILTNEVYGDRFPEVLRAALLSADRPKLLRDYPITQSLSRDLIARNLNEPIVVFRTPGLGFRTTDGSNRTALGFMHPDGYMAWPRAFDGTMVGPHETRHAVYHRGGIDPATSSAKLLDSSPRLTASREQYMSRWPETQAELATLKGQHFQKTGQVIKNKADAEGFFDLLLKDAPKVTDPEPTIQFGPKPMLGKPIPGYNIQMQFWNNMLKKASPQDIDKLIELAPKLTDTTQPRTVA